jgi:hypothetical protein
MRLTKLKRRFSGSVKFSATALVPVARCLAEEAAEHSYYTSS